MRLRMLPGRGKMPASPATRQHTQQEDAGSTPAQAGTTFMTIGGQFQDVNRVNYFTPRFMGLQIGVGYAPKINLTIPVTVDAGGLAKPSTVNFTVPDTTWTALSGKIDFRMYGANVGVKIGLPNPVVFVCKPTKGGAFVSTNAVGQSTITTTTEVASEAPTTTAAGSLVVTGSTGATIVQVIAALLLLDLGYLVLSLRRRPRRAH